jgi:CRP-like cAMP-binding protein
VHENLLYIIRQKNPLFDEESSLFRSSFEAVTLSKNQIIEVAGTIPRYLYFIVEGYLRLYHYDNKGDEVTTHINCPPGFLTSYTHFNNQTRSDENVGSITDCKLLRINKSNLEELMRASSSFKDFSIQVFHESISYNEKRSKELATLTAEQRYSRLLKDSPGIVQHVPVQIIASFLGMKPESLSRIRKLINS